MRVNSIILLIAIVSLLLLLPMASLADNRIITDVAGNTVEIPSEVSRIVTIDPFTSQFFYVIGAENKLVGTCIGPANRNLVNITQPSLAMLPSPGCKTSINLEELLKLKPELVISDKLYAQANEDIRRVGIPLAVVDVEKPETLLKSYEMIGEITGKEKETADFISYYTQKTDNIRKEVSGIADSDRKRVYFGQRDPLSTLGNDYYEAQAARIAGGINVAEELSGGDNTISIDQIYTWNPDVVILLPYCSESVESVLADPAWKSLPAVLKKQVYRMPKYLMSWELPVPESVLGIMWLQNTLYPDKSGFKMDDEIKEFYKKFYRISLTSEDIDAMLKDQTPIILNKPVSS